MLNNNQILVFPVKGLGQQFFQLLHFLANNRFPEFRQSKGIKANPKEKCENEKTKVTAAAIKANIIRKVL